MSELSFRKSGLSYAMLRGGHKMMTPRKNAFCVPTEALAAAIAEEWGNAARYSADAMPLAAIAFSAIDVATENGAKMASAMLAYAETDLLLYRSETPELLARQQEGWNPVVAWAEARYDAHLNVTQGVMPIAQSEAAMKAFRRAAEAMDAFALAAFSVLTQNLGSFLLALAVKEGEISGARAFLLSRIDEDYQAERWGEDSLSLARAAALRRDVLAAEKFLRLPA